MGYLRDLTGGGKVERDFEQGRRMRKITLAAVSRVGGKGREVGDLRGGQCNCVAELQCRAGKDQMEKEGWRRMGSQPLRTFCREALAIFAQESSSGCHLKAILFISC